MKHTQEEALALMKEVLQDELLDLHAEAYKLEENFTEQTCRIFMQVKNTSNGEVMPIEGVGVGIVDACFQGLKQRLSPEYPSLNSISFSAFEMKGIMNTGHDARTDALARVQLGVRNSYGTEFSFDAQSRSTGQSCIEAVLLAVEYFVNAERAFVRMYNARQHYEKEGRADLLGKYTDLMAKMVANTSYSESIAKIKATLK